MSHFKFAIGCIVGAVAGYAAGVLLAPRSGAESRAMASDVVNDAWDSAIDSYERGYYYSATRSYTWSYFYEIINLANICDVAIADSVQAIWNATTSTEDPSEEIALSGYYYGQILAGFGMLFLGLSLMSENLKWMGESDAFRSIADNLSFPLIGILVGIVFTGIIQSSSASVGILMALAMAGVIQNLNEAVFVIFGFNVGACSAALLSSMGANRTSKQIALSNFLISAIGAIIMTLVTIFLPFTSFINMLLPIEKFRLASQI